MLGTISKEITRHFVRKGVIREEKAPIYSYGFELLLATCVNIILVVAISAIFHHTYAGLFFLLAFIPLRTTAGGYHANSHFSCCCVFVGVYVLSLAIVSLMSSKGAPYVCVILAVVSSVIVFRFAPVEAENKPLSQRLRKTNRHRSVVISSLNLLLALILFFSPIHDKWVLGSYFLGVTAASISILVVKLFGVKEVKQ